MKSVILEIKDGYAAILSDDGCITKVKNNRYMIGQVIELNKPKIYKTRKLVACAASVAILIMGFGTSAWAYTNPYSYVSLDVNPSIEYTVNRFDRVLSVRAVNDDGEDILQDIQLNDLENKTIQHALSKTIDQITDQGYFDLNDVVGGIVIATSGKSLEKSVELAKDLQESVEAKLEETDDDVVVEAISVGLERVEEAAMLGVTPGKLNLIETLQESSSNPDSIILEEWLNKPVKDIMYAIKENKKVEKITSTTPDNIAIPSKDTITEAENTDKDNTLSIEAKTIDKAIKKAKKEADKALVTEEKAAKKAKNNAKQPLTTEEKTIEKIKDKTNKSLTGEKRVKEKVKEKIENALTAEEKSTEQKRESDTEKVKQDIKEMLDTQEKAAKKDSKEAEKTVEKADIAVEKAADKTNKTKKDQ